MTIKMLDVLRTRPAVAPVKAPATPLTGIRSRGLSILTLGVHIGASFSIEFLDAIIADKQLYMLFIAGCE